MLRNYANLTVEQRNHEDIKRNTPIIKSLRDEIEEMHASYFQLEKKYRDAVLKDEKMDVIEMKEKIQEYEETL